MRLIDAEELKKKAYPFPCAIGTEYAVTLRDIDQAPTIDCVPMDFHERCMESVIKKKIATEKTNRQILENYVPVVHAMWIKHYIKIGNCDWKYKCSLCGKFNKQYSPPYCPHCGARMDIGGQEDKK